jgi:hypothetical protein
MGGKLGSNDADVAVCVAGKNGSLSCLSLGGIAVAVPIRRCHLKRLVDQIAGDDGLASTADNTITLVTGGVPGVGPDETSSVNVSSSVARTTNLNSKFGLPKSTDLSPPSLLLNALWRQIPSVPTHQRWRTLTLSFHRTAWFSSQLGRHLRSQPTGQRAQRPIRSPRARRLNFILIIRRRRWLVWGTCVPREEPFRGGLRWGSR